MIQPLRTVHRKAFYLIAIVAPLTFAIGLACRTPRSAPVRVQGKALSMKLDGATVWPSGMLATRYTRERDGATIRMDILKPLRSPDPLMYFVPSFEATRANGKEPLLGADLPGDAVLLGPARDEAVFALPEIRGRLVLYSLGARKIVDQLAVEVRP